MTGRDTRSIVKFEKREGEDIMSYKYGDASPLIFKKQEKTSYSGAQLDQLTGKFYNDILNVVYEIKNQEGQLVAFHPRIGSITLTSAMKNTFESTSWFFGSIKFDEDKRGFTLNSENVKGLRFVKIIAN
ncbi:MAG: hypothetical protein AAFY41_11125, partial [Bacteroidota bacterium]